MRRSLPIRVFSILTILTLTVVTHSIDIPTAESASGPAWHVLDSITPMIGGVEWVEKGNYSMPPQHG
jgi:hypothetical protein